MASSSDTFTSRAFLNFCGDRNFVVALLARRQHATAVSSSTFWYKPKPVKCFSSSALARRTTDHGSSLPVTSSVRHTLKPSSQTAWSVKPVGLRTVMNDVGQSITVREFSNCVQLLLHPPRWPQTFNFYNFCSSQDFQFLQLLQRLLRASRSSCFHPQSYCFDMTSLTLRVRP